MREKPKILLLVEGAETEPKFFRNFAKKLGLDATVYSVKTNIYSLYTLLQREDFQLNIKQAAATLTHAEKDKTLLADRYQCTYLVYDCDTQHTKKSWLERLLLFRNRRILKNMEVLGEMARYFRDEYDDTVGKLLLNYPMMESYADTNAFFMVEYKDRLSPVQAGRNYKHLIARRVVGAKPSANYNRGDFSDLVAQNLYKLAYVATGKWKVPEFSEIQKIIDQEFLLSLQRDLFSKKKRLWVLNTSILLPLVLYREEAGYFAELSMARRKKSIAVILPVHGAVKPSHISVFLDNMRAQSFSEWECFIVMPHSRSAEFGVMGNSQENVNVLAVDGVEEDDCLGLVLKGVMASRAEYIMPCLAYDVPVPTAFITMAGLLQVYSECELTMFRRGRRFPWSRFDAKWPELHNKPTKYPVRQNKKAKEACLAAMRKMLIFEMCFKRELFDFVPEKCCMADFTDIIVSHLDMAVRTDMVLFKSSWYR